MAVGAYVCHIAGIDSLSGLSSLEISQKLSRFIGGRSRPLGNVDIAFVTALYLFCNICSQGQVNWYDSTFELFHMHVAPFNEHMLNGISLISSLVVHT